jgi:hypothetical protein
MKCIAILGLVVACLGLVSADASARSVEVEASQVAAIRPSAESEEVRLLVSFDMPDVLEGKEVDFACVSFEANCSGNEGMISFQAFAVTKAWDGRTVSWKDSWDTPGGDWDKRLSAYWIGETGDDKTVYLDVTDFANEWLGEPSRNFGIIVKVSGPFLGTFSVERALAPTLRIAY